MAKTLREIAADMQRRAAKRGRSEVELSRGLSLHLVIRPADTRLMLVRHGVPPSEREVAIVRGAFGVPADAERVSYRAGGGYDRVVLSWPTGQEGAGDGDHD